MVKFTRTPNNLYMYVPPKPQQHVQTVEENKKMHTKREIQRAKRTRELYHAMDIPSVNDFKAIIRMNTIANYPVTVQDIDLAETIFGPDIGSLKGKTT